MDYSQAIGQVVVAFDGSKGKITKFDENHIFIELENHGFGSGGYLFDPFLHEGFRFDDPEWQNKVDEEICRIDQKAVRLIEKSSVNALGEELFRITKDKDGTKETVLRLKRTEQEAFCIFGHVITEQGRIFDATGVNGEPSGCLIQKRENSWHRNHTNQK